MWSVLAKAIVRTLAWLARCKVASEHEVTVEWREVSSHREIPGGFRAACLEASTVRHNLSTRCTMVTILGLRLVRPESLRPDFKEGLMDSWRKHTGASPVYWALLMAVSVALSPVGVFAVIGAMAVAAMAIDVRDRGARHE